MTLKAPWPAPAPAVPAPTINRWEPALRVGLQVAVWIVQYTLVFFVALLWLTAKFFVGMVIALLNRNVAAATLAVELVAGRRIRGDRTHWLVELARPWRLPR